MGWLTKSVDSIFSDRSHPDPDSPSRSGSQSQPRPKKLPVLAVTVSDMMDLPWTVYIDGDGMYRVSELPHVCVSNMQDIPTAARMELHAAEVRHEEGIELMPLPVGMRWGTDGKPERDPGSRTVSTRVYGQPR